MVIARQRETTLYVKIKTLVQFISIATTTPVASEKDLELFLGPWIFIILHASRIGAFIPIIDNERDDETPGENDERPEEECAV